VLGDEKPVTVRPADLLEPQLPAARREIADYMVQEEDLLSYILFPNVALDFFKRRRGLLPPLSASTQEVSTVKKADPGSREPDFTRLTEIDESLLRREGRNLIYPV